MTKKIFFIFISTCFLCHAQAQERQIFSKLPCAAEVWQIAGDNWEEILLCDLNPKDPSTWTWYYNYKTNKKGLLKFKVISQWKDSEGFKLLIKMPNNSSKYKISQVAGTKDLKMEKVEGNMDISYKKEFDKIK